MKPHAACAATLLVVLTASVALAQPAATPPPPGEAQTGASPPQTDTLPLGQAGWIADARTGCRIWAISLQPGLSALWSGGCEDGRATGEGVLQWSVAGRQTERYEGSLVGGRPQGRGSYTWADGEWYVGDYLDGRRHGRGAYFFRSGSLYVGDFVADLRTGLGIANLPDGTRYEGEWRGGQRYGRGVVTRPDGRRYSGEWRDTRPLAGSLVELDPAPPRQAATDRPIDIWPFPPDWLTDLSTGCKVWNVTPLPQETVTWSGQCQNGYGSGQGELVWLQAGRPFLRMEGTLQEGRLAGRVRITGEEGGRYAAVQYEGGNRDGLPHGNGTLTLGRTQFSGNWVDGCLKNRAGAVVAYFGRTLSDCR